MFAELLRRSFPELDPVIDDLLLLECHQIASLPERAPAQQLAAVLHADPRLHRFLVTRHPPIEAHLTRLLAQHAPAASVLLPACQEALVWEIADWIVYQRAPDLYDDADTPKPSTAAVTNVARLEGKTVVDAGAGTGTMAFALAPLAATVFAVEPVSTLRKYMRHKSKRLGADHLHPIDGLLHAVPLPSGSVDVLVTRRSIGWRLSDELAEVERVLGSNGVAVHLLGRLTDEGDELHRALEAHGYAFDIYEEGSEPATRFWKQLGA